MLRERLAAGKKPRVVLLVDTAVGAKGTSVPVVSFSEPAVGEFITVRLRDDVVPFSPAELSLPVRGRRGGDVASATEPPVAPAPMKPTKPAPPTPPTALPLDAPAEPQRPARLVAVPEPQPEAEPEAQPEPADTRAPAKAAAAAPTPARPAPRRSARSGGFSVTLRFSGQSWTYESTRGGRRSSARPLNLAAVRAFADRLDDPALRRDMQGAIDVCRQQAQTRAEVLRAELERVEVELAELDE